MTGDAAREDERPLWARRIRDERTARGWSQAQAVEALRAHSAKELPANGSLLRNWKRWEAGETEPDDFYQPLIAKTFGTVTAAFFPRPSGRDADAELIGVFKAAASGRCAGSSGAGALPLRSRRRPRPARTQPWAA